EVVGLHQQLVRARGLDRVEIGTLQVLDERELESVSDLAAHDSGDRGLAGKSRRQNASMSRDELVAVAVGRYHNRLQDAMARNRRRQLRETIGVECGARLVPIGAHKLERDLVCLRTFPNR